MHVNDGKGGEERREQVEERKTATTPILAAIPEGTPAVHLPFKSSSTDRHNTEADNYKAPPCQSKQCACSVHADKKGFLSTAPWLYEKG